MPGLLSIGVTLVAAACVAAGSGSSAAAGRFLAEGDSLGFDQFRELDPSAQIAARGRAEGWIEESRRAVVRGAPADRIAHGLDCAATAAGTCPYLALAWVQYAEVSTVVGDFEFVAECLVHARRTLPYTGDPAEREQLGVEIDRLQALASLNRGEFDRALAAAESVLDHRPEDWATRLVAARCLLRDGRFDEAARLIALYPADDPHAAEAAAVMGAAELGRGREDAAAREFRRAEEAGIDDAVLENDRGRLCLVRGDLAGAMRHFRAALDRRGDFSEAACNLAVAQKRAGDLGGATATLEALVRRVPGYAPAHLNLAEVFRERAAEADGAEATGFAERAREHYDRALAAGADATLVAERRATLVAWLGASPGSSAAGGSVDSLSAHALTVMARAEKEAGGLAEAESLLALAATREGADALCFAELGEVRLRRGDWAGAREALERACAMDSTLVVSRINLSIACEELGDLPGAFAALDEAIAIDPDHPLVVHRTSSEGRPR